MGSLADLNQQIERLADRLRSARKERSQKLTLALSLLAEVEERVKVQRAALDEAQARIGELEAERTSLLTRVNEIVGLYDSGITENETLINRIEQLSEQVAADTGGPKAEPSAVLPVVPESVAVQGPVNTLFLRETDTDKLPPRERFKDNDAIRRLYNQYQRNGGRSSGGLP